MYVTLNIGAGSLRVLSVKGRQVKKWGSLPLDTGQVRDGLILQPQAVGEAIDAMFKLIKVPKERVIISLTGLSFTYRFLNLPRLKPSLLEEAVPRAAAKEISLPLDELYLSWQPIGVKDDEQEFFVLGVPRNLIDTLMQTLAVAGVPPYLVDLKPLALARAAHRGEAIIANLEPDCYDIILVAEGIPTIMHTLIPRGEGATLEDNLRRLTDEISRTVSFYQSNHPENSPSPATPLLLSGGLAAEATTSGLIQAEIEYPVEPLIPPLEFPPDLPLAPYATNMGLALKKLTPKTTAKGEGVRFRDINVNLLSGKYRQARARPLPSGHMLVIIFLIMALGLLFPVYQAGSQLDAENTYLQDELRIANRELNLAILTAEETARTEETIQIITANATTLKQGLQNLLSTRGDFASNLILVTEALPPQAYFTSIEIGHDLIVVQGETDSPFTVVDYATALETNEVLSEVRVTEIDENIFTGAEDTESEPSPVERQVITFEIIMKKVAWRN